MNLLKKLPLMAFVLGLGLILSVGTMSSFKAVSGDHTESTASYWYVKNPTTGVYQLQEGPPPSCLIDETEVICALGFNSPQSNVTDASLPSSVDQRYRPE